MVVDPTANWWREHRSSWTRILLADLDLPPAATDLTHGSCPDLRSTLSPNGRPRSVTPGRSLASSPACRTTCAKNGP